MDVLTNCIMVIILQYIHISNHHVVYLKIYTMFDINYITVKLERKKGYGTAKVEWGKEEVYSVGDLTKSHWKEAYLTD